LRKLDNVRLQVAGACRAVVLVRLNHVASFIVNANHGAILETIREQADSALRQIQESEEQRSIRWKCKAFWMFMLKIYLEGVTWAAITQSISRPRN